MFVVFAFVFRTSTSLRKPSSSALFHIDMKAMSPKYSVVEKVDNCFHRPLYPVGSSLNIFRQISAYWVKVSLSQADSTFSFI
jgi:hypothetical protein